MDFDSNDKTFKEGIEKEIRGAESAVRKMLLYYISALQMNGVEDVKQYIATRMGELISLSEEQCNFITMNLKREDKIAENLENCVQLLQSIEDNKKLDLDSVKIVKQVLELILKDLEEFRVIDYDDK